MYQGGIWVARRIHVLECACEVCTTRCMSCEVCAKCGVLAACMYVCLHAWYLAAGAGMCEVWYSLYAFCVIARDVL